jgi:hypothetical protein
LALGVAPLLESQMSRRHIISGPAIGTFENLHPFTMNPALMMCKGCARGGEKVCQLWLQ